MTHTRLLLVIALAGCEAASAKDVPATRFEHDMMVRFHMHENYGLLRAIELELVHGRLDDARSLARIIAEAPEEPGLEPFAKASAAVRARAADVAAAPGIDEACRREARVAEACADCHAQAGVLPEFASVSRAPADVDTVPARMARHVWATQRLWEGIIGRSDESWRSGLDVLAATPLPWTTLDADRKALAAGLQQTADSARKTMDTSTTHDRARQYGEILVACVACHTAAKH